MATKFCSTMVVDNLFSALYVPNGNLRLVIMTSSDVLPTIAGCSSPSDGMLAHSTKCGAAGNAFPTSSHIALVIGDTGLNRYMTIAACSCDDVLRTGIASYVCIIDDSSSVRFATTCTTQELTLGNKVNIGSWQITINQPT